MHPITTNFLFNHEALEAAEYYVDIFPDSRVSDVSRYGEGAPLPAGTVLAVNFVLNGQEFTAINSGASIPFTASMSLRVTCEGQAEVDRVWARLSDGGEEGRCGWLTDRFGVSWQVTPVEMGRYLGDPDPERARRAMSAMLQMGKIDLAAFEAAVAGA